MSVECAYRFPTDGEMQLAICGALGIAPEELRDGRRLRRVNHVIQLVQVYHREARATGLIQGFKKRAAVAAKLWPHVDRERQKNSMWRWEETAERAGLLSVIDGRGARALKWELLDGWQQQLPAFVSTSGALESGDRRRSSAGNATSCPPRRRRETRRERHQRRVRPHCRRVGNKTGSVGRLLAPTPSLKGLNYLSLSGLGVPPTGKPPSWVQDVRTRGPGSVDAADGHRDPPAIDALSVPPLVAAAVARAVEVRAAGTAAAREGLDELHRAADAGGDPVAIASAGWRLLFDDRPGLTWKRRLQLERSCTALDRARGRPGAGVHRLLSWMWAVACDLEDRREDERVGVAPALGRHVEQPAPATLSYFVARLRSLARSERRAWRQARRAPGAPGSSGSGTDG